MSDKVKVIAPEKKENVVSMIVGTVLVALGMLLFVSGAVMLVLYNLPPREDLDLVKPTILQLPATTNQKSVDIKGTTEYTRVMVWVNDEVVAKNLVVNNGEFLLNYPTETEGSYTVDVAAIKGFPIRHRSEKTTGIVVADFTAPKNDVKFSYNKEVDVKVFSISGTIEPNTEITLQKNGKEYSATSNEFGKFKIKNIPLSLGKNNFKVELKDNAGNVTKLDKGVSVVYASGQINGGASTSNLPESAGNMSNELAYTLGNSLMGVFGLIALAIFSTNLGIVVKKLRKVSV